MQFVIYQGWWLEEVCVSVGGVTVQGSWRRRYEWEKKGLGWRRGCLTDFTACWPCSIDAVLAI